MASQVNSLSEARNHPELVETVDKVISLALRLRTERCGVVLKHLREQGEIHPAKVGTSLDHEFLLKKQELLDSAKRIGLIIPESILTPSEIANRFA